MSIIKKTQRKTHHKTKDISRYTKKYKKIQKNTKYNKKKIIVSYFNDNTNIYHIFCQEIMKIWNESKGNLDTIIVLKNYVNNNINNWRFTLLKSVYKNVYIHTIPNTINNIKVSSKTFTVIDILKDKYNKWLNESFKFIKIPKSQHYIKLATIIKQNIYTQINTKYKTNKGKYVAFIYRTNNRILYDYKTKEIVHTILSRELKKLNIPFKMSNFDNASFEEQAEFLQDVKVMIACHGAAFTNLILLPQNASIMEVSFKKYWFCDPICDCHLSGRCSYKEDCHTVSNSRYYNKKSGKLEYHKADYFNLSQLFGIGYKEILIEDANGYFKKSNDKDYNPINLTNLYIDTNEMIDKIKKCIKSCYI